jgi:hypothetical protein
MWEGAGFVMLQYENFSRDKLFVCVIFVILQTVIKVIDSVIGNCN